MIIHTETHCYLLCCLQWSIRFMLKKKFKKIHSHQQDCFNLQNNQYESKVHPSFVVVEMIAKYNRPFIDFECIKKCMLAIVDKKCPEKKKTI